MSTGGDVPYWSFWVGGVALAVIALGHWATTGRLLRVSSRFTALVDRVRGVPGASSREETAEPASAHIAFFVGVMGGGLVAALLGGRLAMSFTPGTRFVELFGSSPIATALVMAVGGTLVGFGTRMARGCTSGHGLCGVARVQPGSLLATAAFFGTGIVVSIVLGMVLG